MTNLQSSSQQESLNMLSPEAKEFVPRHFSDTTSPAASSGDGLLGSSPAGMVLDDSGQPRREPVNGLPSYMTTCYPFVPAGDQRFGGLRAKFRAKYAQQPMLMTHHFQPLQSGIARNRFPHPTKGFVPAPTWPPAAIQHFGSLPNGMPFDGGTDQNGFIRPSLSQMTVHDGKTMINPGQQFAGGNNCIGTPHLTNGYIDHAKYWKNNHKAEEIPGSSDGANPGSSDGAKQVCYKGSSVQTDFQECIANATLEETPNTLYSNGQVAYKDHHKPTTRRTRHSSNINSSDADDNSLHRHNTVSNGTNTATDFSHGIHGAMVIPDNGIGHVTKSSGSSSALSMSSGAVSNVGTGFKGLADGINSMHETVNKVPYSNECIAISTSRCSYASIAQSQPSQINKQNLVTTATNKNDHANCDNSVTINRTMSARQNAKNSARSASRLGNVNVNVAEIMQDLERADNYKQIDTQSKHQNAYQKYTENETFKGKSLYSAAVKEQPHSGNQPLYSVQKSNVPTIHENRVQGHFNYQGNYHFQQVGQTFLRSQQVVRTHMQFNTQQIGHAQAQIRVQQFGNSQPPITNQYSGIQTQQVVQSQVKVQQVQSDSNKSDLDLDKKGQSLSDNANNLGEGGEVKKKKRRRRRRKKKSGETTGENDDDCAGVSEEITLHFEDEDEFPDLSGATSCDATNSSLFIETTVSYSEILMNTTAVQSTKSSSQEDHEDPCSPDTTGAFPLKESRSSRKRRKRREVANKAADAELAEINLEQHMLELKMKQKLPLSAKKSVSPVRNAPSQGVWKLTPSSPATQLSSTGKKVSLLLPGTVAPEPAHNTTTHQPNSSAVKQPGILKTSQQPLPSGGKKSKQPMTYDLGAMLDALEFKKEQTPPKKELRPIISKKDDNTKTLNALDASGPTVKRGKERETPKIKKPSPLKKVILKEREEKKRMRLLDEDEVANGAPVGIGIVSGGESDLSQDASFKSSTELGLGTPASAELSPISQQSPSCMSPMSPGASPLSSGVTSPVTGAIQQTVKLKIHSRRFREYCNQVLDKEIDNHVTALLQDLVRFQDKQFHKDPIKAKSKRRFVLGLREVTKHLKLKKIKCVIISPNLEKIQSKGGLDDALNLILELCNDQKVPFIFALGRRALGRACAKLVPVSVVGVFNYEGSEENFKSLVNLTEKARDAYREMIVQIEIEIAEHPPRACLPGVPHIFAHMGHSRTPSGCSVISFTSSILSEPISENYPHSEPETDNRGYEIEKEDAIDDIDDGCYNDGDTDPYEADDERGYHKMKKAKNMYPDNDTVEYYDDEYQLEGDNSNEKTDVNENRYEESTRVMDTYQQVTDGSVEVIDESGISRTNAQQTNQDNNSDNDDESDHSDFSDENDAAGDKDVDDVNDDDESEFDTCDDNSDANQTEEGEDTVKDLPTFIESVHHFDLSEILSQHSSKTMENGEDVMSTHSSKTTHSSRTLGDSSGLTGDKTGKKLELKNADKTGSSPTVKGKPGVDKDLKENRTRSWVKEAQNLHFNDQVESPRDTEENVIEVKNVVLESLDVVR